VSWSSVLEFIPENERGLVNHAVCAGFRRHPFFSVFDSQNQAGLKGANAGAARAP
jgi:hypothetical protein